MALRVGSHTSARVATAAFALSALLLALAALLGAPGASAKARAKPPEITSVSPSRTTIGERVTVRGRHFRRGKGRNTLVLKRDGARSVFVRADISTTKMMRVTIPARLTRFLAVENGTPRFTRFRPRVISVRLGRSFTSVTRSPVIGPEKPPAPPAKPVPPADGDCDADGTLNAADEDDDGDLLSDATEARLKTDACRLDTDGDGVGDGYEFQSALHLNNDEYQEPNNSLP
ncbi:MAG: IPT/TIG domain-containing protein, partial [Solirubrobacterales bacterium]|nr:IPT/TIG domain-containing protein [Solirubrobacterales bacterium]